MARQVSQGESELSSVSSRVGDTGLALTGQSSGKGGGRDAGGPAGSKLPVSENAATNHITTVGTLAMFTTGYALPPGRKGDNREWQGNASDWGRQCQPKDYVKVTGAYVTQGKGFNLFSLHGTQSRLTITLDKDGARLIDHRLTFPGDDIGS